MVKRTREQIREVDFLLPDSTISSFRERLVTYLENASGAETTESELHQKAQALVLSFKDDFGVNDLIDSEQPW